MSSTRGLISSGDVGSASAVGSPPEPTPNERCELISPIATSGVPRRSDQSDGSASDRPSGSRHVSVEGDAHLEIDIRLPVPLERTGAVSPGYTANTTVNAIPFVCGHEEGSGRAIALATGPGVKMSFSISSYKLSTRDDGAEGVG
jgi:hypothetical protein